VNLNCIVAQLILTVSHLQEFLSSVHCINLVHIKTKSLNYDYEQGKQGFPSGYNYAILPLLKDTNCKYFSSMLVFGMGISRPNLLT